MMNFLFSFSPMSVLLWIIILVLLLLYLLGRYYFFVKIGIDGWKGLIPIYSEYLYYKKGRVEPWLAPLFICLYLLFYFLGNYFVASDELCGIILFFKFAVVIVALIVSWNVNYYIGNKFKEGYLLPLALTFVPIFAVPFIGLYEKMRWSRLTKVRNNFLWDDFYSNKKISVNEMCISNILLVLSTVIGFYVAFYVMISLFSFEKVFEMMWDFKFIFIIAIFISIVVIVGTLFDYFINKYILNKRR